MGRVRRHKEYGFMFIWFAYIAGGLEKLYGSGNLSAGVLADLPF